MSNRGGGHHQPVGASARSDLFGNNDSQTDRRHQDNNHSSRPNQSSSQNQQQQSSRSQSQFYRHPQIPPPPLSSDVLELEHLIGYTGSTFTTLLSHSTLPGIYIKSLGPLLVICDTSDPHEQKFLRSHDHDVSALCVSKNGTMIASGQKGSVTTPGYPSPVIIWDFETRAPIFVLRGHTRAVQSLSFSPDSLYLASTGLDNVMYIWDLSTGEIVYSKTFSSPLSLFKWSVVNNQGRRSSYEIVIVGGNNSSRDDVLKCVLAYDAVRSQWSLSTSPFTMPSSGLNRTYLSGLVDKEEDCMLAGTSIGDLLVFNIKNNVYRASVPVCGNGLISIAMSPSSGDLFCGGGDGTLKKLRGRDMRWELVNETLLDGKVTSLTIMEKSNELLAGTDKGTQYIVSADNLNARVLSTSHTSPINCISFGTRSDVFATGDIDGTIKVWDLSDYATIRDIGMKGKSSVNALCWIGDSTIVAGYADSFIRAFDVGTGSKMWDIPNAHKGAVSCLTTHTDSRLSFLVSGGVDGAVRVWSLKLGRALMIQFAEHRKGVTGVLVDVKKPNLIHSCSVDCSLLTYDLIKEKRVVSHMTREGSFLAMTQRLDSEQEVITSDSNGRMLFWDCDYSNPTSMLQDPSSTSILSLQMSPSGRYLATTGEDQFIKVFDIIDSGNLIAIGEGGGEGSCVNWSPDEKQIVSVSGHAGVWVWNFFGAGE